MGNRQKSAREVPNQEQRRRADTPRVPFNRRIGRFSPDMIPSYFTIEGFRAADVIENEDEDWTEDEEPWQDEGNE